MERYKDKQLSAYERAAALADTLSTEEQAQQLSLSVGDRVRVRQGATDYKGKKLAAFVYRTVYQVQQISGDRIVIGIGGQVTAAMHAADLTRI